MNDFNSVVTRYNNTTPVNEREHGITRDLRPIGPRGRKWERIIKFSDNCYGLADGYGWYGGDYADSVMKKVVPILWQRTRDGYEKVTVRAGFGSQNNSRYDFLQCWLPNNMHFIFNLFGKTKHGIRINTNRYYDTRTASMSGATDYHLPNQEFRPWMLAYRDGTNPYQVQWAKKNPALYKKYTTDDRKLLVFKRKIGETDWVLDSKPHLIERKSIKVSADKKSYRKVFADFYEYAYTMGCMLPQEPRYVGYNHRDDAGYEHRQKQMQEYREHVMLQRQVIADFAGVTANTYYGGHNWSGLTPELVRDILTNDEHELRVALITNVWHACGWSQCDWQDKDDQARARSRYNAHMNKIAGFTKPVTRKTEK